MKTVLRNPIEHVPIQHEFKETEEVGVAGGRSEKKINNEGLYIVLIYLALVQGSLSSDFFRDFRTQRKDP